MVYHHEHHHVEFHKALHDKMSKIYVFQAFMTFVKSLVGVFIPVYLYSLGYSLIQIFSYVIVFSLIYLLFIPLSIWMIRKIGFKYMILLSIPIYVLHIISLNYLDNIVFFYLASASFGLYLLIFWPSMHSEIALNGSNKHRGSQIGNLQIIVIVVTSLAPLIGGIFFEYLTYYKLLLVSLFLMGIGTIPMIFSKDVKLRKYHFNYSDYLRLIKNRRYKNSKMAFSFEGIEHFINSFIWPIIIFLFFQGNFAKLGVLFTFVSVLSIIFILKLKKYLDKKNKNEVLRLATKLQSFNVLLKTMITLFGSIFLYFIESLSKLIHNSTIISFNSIFYNNAHKLGYMDYIILREIYLQSAKIFFCLISIGFIFLFGENIMNLFIILCFGIVSSLGLSFLKEEN